MGQDSPYNKLWGQMIRWLAGQDVRDRQRGAGLEALLNKSNFQLGENVKVRAMVRDEHGDATKSCPGEASRVTNTADRKTQTLSMGAAEIHSPACTNWSFPIPTKGITSSR